MGKQRLVGRVLGTRDLWAGLVLVLAVSLLVLGALEMGVALRAQADDLDVPGSARLDYGSVARTFAPLGADFIDSVLGRLIEIGPPSEEPSDTIAAIGGGPILAQGSDEEPPRFVDEHPLTNDDYSHARSIPGIPFTARTNDAAATRESSDPDACGSVGGTVWYRYTATRNVGLVAFTYGTDHNITLGVFKDGQDLRKLGCDSDARGNTLVTFPARRGQSYLFQLTAPVGGGELVFHLEPHGQFELVSDARATTPPNGESSAPSISASGRYIAFRSYATNLVPGVDDRPCAVRNSLYAVEEQMPCPQIYVRDTRTDETEIVSVTSKGQDGNGHSDTPFISADGRYVAFESAATDLSDKDHPIFLDIFVYDRLKDKMDWIATTGREGYRSRPSVSDNGRYVAFVSVESLLPRDTNNERDVYVFDRWKDRYELVSVSSEERPSEYTEPRVEPEPCTGGLAPGGALPELNPYITGDGRWVVFRSDATNLVPNDGNGEWDTFVRDRVTGRTERVSVSSRGQQGNGSSYYTYSQNAQISADGRYVVFASCASNLAPADRDDFLDVFLHDRVADRTRLLSGGLGLGEISGFPSISGNGRFVTFDSEPVAIPDEPSNSDVYRHDVVTGITSFVTLAPSGTDSSGWTSAISADGRAVAFFTEDPAYGDYSSGNVFVYRAPRAL
ncbi:MAG TPA: hypothetical protein VG408_01490 [Actinomycetota bacterium]|nr:hypothetical protein [Actinomycetota bacterium]